MKVGIKENQAAGSSTGLKATGGSGTKTLLPIQDCHDQPPAFGPLHVTLSTS